MILLDAPVFVRWVGGDPSFGSERHGLLDRRTEPLALCQSALIEIGEAWKAGKWSGELPLQVWLETALSAHQIVLLPSTPSIVSRAAQFTVGDVWDRLFLATALEHDLEVATLDSTLRQTLGIRQLF